MKYLFGDIVVVEKNNIGVIVKSWVNQQQERTYEVYVRMYNNIKLYKEEEVERYKVRHKYLNDEELSWQNSF